MSTIEAVQERYSALADSSCCLSCGSAAGACEPEPGQVCLDLGSGRGTDVLRFAEAVGPTGHAYGVDLADGMLQKARRTAEKLGVQNATFLRAPLDRLPLPDNSVDWVASNCVLNHASDKLAVWREIARVLKPGGRFVVSDIYAIEAIPEALASDPEAVAECWAGAVPRDEYLGHIAAAGLREVRVVEESKPYEKGQAVVASFTLAGTKAAPKRCCQGG